MELVEMMACVRFFRTRRVIFLSQVPMSPLFLLVCIHRFMLFQVGSDGSSWVPGFFDRGSYQEYLSGWGKSIVVGRARIGGIPMGVINVETRLSEQVNGACGGGGDCCVVVV